jgi:hypothetical protein
MKILRNLFVIAAMLPGIAAAQFISGQVLTAAGLNSALAAPTITSGTINGAAIGAITPAVASFTGINAAYQSTYAPGSRAPLFIWQNPNGSTAAGHNAGQQIWIGTNPTATPGAGDTVASTIGVSNGNNRSGMWAQNILVGLCGAAEGCSTSDYINGPVYGQEIDVYGSASWTPQNRAFNPTAGTYAINGQEVYCQGPQYCTSAYSAWSTSTNGSNWFKEGLSLNRIYDYGIHFSVTPGDTATGFGGAAIQDDSNSTVTLEIGSGTHAYYINAPNFQVTGAGVLTTGAGITGSPISGSTGSFTTLSASGLITPSSTIGIKGTATNDDAITGSVGEWNNSITSGTSLSTGVNTNCASALLAAGDYDVRGTIQFVPAGTTTVSAAFASISTTSAAAGGLTGGQTGTQATFTTGQQQYVSTRTARVKMASSGTVYLVGSLGFGTSTATCTGFIEWRRTR